MLESPEFWVAVGFVALLGLIWRPVSRNLAAALDARSARIAASLEEAAQLRQDAQHLLAEYQRKQRGSAREREELVAHARAEAEHLAREAEARLADALARREQLSLEKIALAEADALAEVRGTTVDVAITATARLIASRLDKARAAALVDGAVAELPDKLRLAG